jgi:hypothetical protein
MRTRLVLETLSIQILLTLCTSQVWAGCLNPPVSAQSVSQFKSDPKTLVAPGSDSRTVEALVRDLAGTDASLAADLVRVARGTLPRFQTAIAAGLAQAAIACANVDQQAALLIQQAVASFEDGQFQASFAAVAGDLSTAATDAATTSAAGSAGSVTVTNPNTSSKSNTTPGGEGNTLLVMVTPAALTINPTNPTKMVTPNSATPSSVATTAANPVSFTR